MKSTAQQIAKKYSVDYNDLIGRGKSHQVQAARRELVYELLENDFDVNVVAKFLGNRNVNQIWWLYESYKSREDNKRTKPGPRKTCGVR